MNRKKILVIGVGQIGIRYIQGLSNHLEKFDIHCYDISPEAMINVKNYFNQSQNITLVEKFEDIPNELDLAIISTTSKSRVQVIENLLKQSQIESWIIEKVLSPNIVELKKLKKLANHTKNAYVNHTFRVNDWAKDLKNIIDVHLDIMSVEIYGGRWGLACNSTHFIDLFSHLINSKVKSINSKKLGRWHESKRPGYLEVYGTLIVDFINGSTMSLNSEDTSDMIDIKIYNTSEIVIAKIKFTEKNIKIHFGNNVKNYKIPYLSEISAELSNDVIDSNSRLPKLDNSLILHDLFLRSLEDNYYKNNNKIFSIT